MKRKPAFKHVREVEAFLEMLQAERGASKNTLLAYAADLADLQGFLARRKQSTVTADFRTGAVQHTVAVRVGHGGIGSHHDLGPIGEAVVIRQGRGELSALGL